MNRIKFLYEVLLRLGPDGFQGAHVIELERIVDGDEVLSERELPARPVTEAEVGPLIGAESARLVEALDQAAAELQQEKLRSAELANQLEAAVLDAETVRKQLAEHVAQAESLASQLAAALATPEQESTEETPTPDEQPA